MIAMRYGNLPLATATGGLKDTIIDYDSDLEKATGFLFTGQTSEAFLKRLDDALTVFKDQSVWRQMQHHAMTSDFSWANSAQSYLQVYRDLISDLTA
jgi:starch synthase